MNGRTNKLSLKVKNIIAKYAQKNAGIYLLRFLTKATKGAKITKKRLKIPKFLFLLPFVSFVSFVPL